ncbi:MAG: hypothetical protein JO033_21365 [Acidobacteriaceae bacterium]|nr:hypothetical protein [Acidobacteriaceae bacterium]MBV9498570.1 hypothetical protein [Acidobacteriaceae bacterium]
MKRLPVDFSRLRTQRSRRNELPLNIKPNLRQAQLSGLPLSDAVVCFSSRQIVDLECFRPQVLIGSVEDLQRTAERASLGIADLSSVDYAVLALSPVGEAPISDKFRVFLWQTFGVPVFELVTGPNGAVLAADCEAHEGWHLQRNASAAIFDGELQILQKGQQPIRTRLTCEIETKPCPCGRDTPRIANVQLRSRANSLNMLAASA